ncbi:MAG: hypothetical protein HEP71_24925 [Roseivirga sp.]|nr:hypothetical protein [Roseivirga sp.]
MTIIAQKIPFEIHLTTEGLPAVREEEFIRHCESVGAKALLIELSRGSHVQQPMLSTVVHSNSLLSVLSEANELSSDLARKGFGSKRLKIEIPAYHAHLFAKNESTFDRYFEWHGKIRYTNTDMLQTLCLKHKVHLSINSLKSATGFRFITLREYGTQQVFEERIHQLLEDFEKQKLTIDKQQAEFCIYDNNSFLDEGWLPQ